MTERMKCAECEASIPDHAWGRIKASDWFFSKDGKSYCPAHVPEWVEAWRERKRQASGDAST